jgi:hypothetical protein
MILAGGSYRTYLFSEAIPTWTPDCSLESYLLAPKAFDFGVLFIFEEESIVSPSSSRSKELPPAALLDCSLIKACVTGLRSLFSSLSFFHRQNMSFSLSYI